MRVLLQLSLVSTKWKSVVASRRTVPRVTIPAGSSTATLKLARGAIRVDFDPVAPVFSPASFQHLCNVEVLHLNRACPLDLPATFSHLTTLRELCLSALSNRIMPFQNIDDAFAQLPHLEVLTAPWSGCSDAGLQHLTSLTRLDVRGCTLLTDAALEGMTRLRALTIDNRNSFSGSALAAVPRLQELWMRRSRLPLTSLADVPQLRTVSISGCGPIPAGALTGLVHLTRLEMVSCELASPAELSSLTDKQKFTSEYRS